MPAACSKMRNANGRKFRTVEQARQPIAADCFIVAVDDPAAGRSELRKDERRRETSRRQPHVAPKQIGIAPGQTAERRASELARHEPAIDAGFGAHNRSDSPGQDSRWTSSAVHSPARPTRGTIRRAEGRRVKRSAMLSNRGFPLIHEYPFESLGRRADRSLSYFASQTIVRPGCCGGSQGYL